jgi:8-oxo-dGTP pyrophosphatase MutT (NUDIX family)
MLFMVEGAVTSLKNQRCSSVASVMTCQLASKPLTWPFATERAAQVDAHWQRRKQECPGFFNGRVQMLASYALSEDVVTGEFFETEFKNFLYWRETGERDHSVSDAFGSALMRSSEGHVILGRQRPGNVNSGLASLPGGFIDARDVRADGMIDIDASIAREMMEETGLDARAFVRKPGYLVTRIAQQVSFAVEFVSPDPADVIQSQVRAFLARDPKSELEDVVIIRSKACFANLPTPAYAGVLLNYLFD